MDVSPARVGRYGRGAARWARLAVAGRPVPGVRVFYGHDRVPGPGERAAGGTVKMQKLAEAFPNTPVGFSLLYLGTTWLPRDLRPLLALVRRRGIPLVVTYHPAYLLRNLPDKAKAWEDLVLARATVAKSAPL